MHSRTSRPSRITALLTIVLVWAASALWSGSSAAQQTSTLFTGGTPSRGDIGNVTTTRLKFPKGSRSNWHSHISGQLLMVEDGKDGHRSAANKYARCCPATPGGRPQASSTGTARRPTWTCSS